MAGNKPLYSRKLHMRVLRARTSCVTSRTIFDFSFGERVVNHFDRRCPTRESVYAQARGAAEEGNEPLCPAGKEESGIYRSSISY